MRNSLLSCLFQSTDNCSTNVLTLFSTEMYNILSLIGFIMLLPHMMLTIVMRLIQPIYIYYRVLIYLASYVKMRIFLHLSLSVIYFHNRIFKTITQP